MKAMILAAGLGTRLRPLTLERAKPAIPLLGKPLVARLIERLIENGAREFRLNLHHLPLSIEGVFKRPQWAALPVSFSFEPDILGTAGGLKANESLFADETFLLVNGDIVMDFTLDEAIVFHRERGAFATLILYPQSPPFRYTPVRIDDEGLLHNFKNAGAADKMARDQAYVFTGVHILEPEIFDFIPAGRVCEINDEVYPSAIRAGRRVYGLPVEGYWNDLGSPARYLEAQQHLLNIGQHNPPVHISPLALVADRAVLGPHVSVEAGSVIEADTYVENAVLWENVVVKRGSIVRNCIIGSGVTIGSGCSDRVVTRNGEAPIV